MVPSRVSENIPRTQAGELSATFVHLSDIHFRSVKPNDPFDLDADLRVQLESDLERVRDEMGSITGFLVTGDVAFSGDPVQYENATHWFNRLSEIARCNYDSVWLVPGNHDVDWRIIEQSPQTIGGYHTMLRSCGLDAIDESLDQLLNKDMTAKEILFKPLGAYAAFAERYGCGFENSKPHWHYPVPGGGPYSVQIRGINSALISDRSDSSTEDRSKLVVGRVQCQLPKDDCSLVIALCHHPDPWLRDATALRNLLDNRAVLQITGHEHNFTVEHEEATLRIRAGAVHPVRKGDWQSRYNVIRLTLANLSDPTLNIELLPRKWDEEEDAYVADKKDGKDVWEYRVKIPLCGAKDHKVSESARPREGINVSVDDVGSSPTVPQGAEDPHRYLAFRFLTLSLLDRLQVLQDLGLLEAGDERRPIRDLYEVAFARAKEHNQLVELWDQVEGKHGGGTTVTNPFRERGAT